MKARGIERLSGRRWLGRLLAAIALVLAIAVVVVVVMSAGSSTPSAASSQNKASGATTVERRNLTETDTESGTLSYSSPQTVYNRLSGTITWLPQVGQEIKPGQALYKVDGHPVILMDGTTPAYRDLTPSDSDGPDVQQLNRNLVRLGFNASNITVDDVWQPATTEGVDLLQESLGETETGILSLGQIVFLPGDQLVTTVDGTLGGTGSGSSAANASALVTAPAPEFVSYQVPHGPSAHKEPKAAKKCPTTTNSSSGTDSTNGNTPATTQTKQPQNCKKKNGSVSKQQELNALLQLLKAETAQLKADHGSSPGGSGGSGGSGGGGGGGGGKNSGNSGSGRVRLGLGIWIRLWIGQRVRERVGQRRRQARPRSSRRPRPSSWSPSISPRASRARRSSAST